VKQEVANSFGRKCYNMVELLRQVCILVSEHEKRAIHVYRIKSKIFTVVLVLLVLLGQATAAQAFPCKMDTNGTQEAMPKGMMDHSDHTFDEVDNVDTVLNPDSSGCCHQDNSCFMGGCVSILLPAIPLYAGSANTRDFSQSRILTISQPPTSLYRPPIYR